MEETARTTSEGQVTVPESVRDAPDFLALGGSFSVPAAKRNAAWDDVLRRTRVERMEDRR